MSRKPYHTTISGSSATVIPDDFKPNRKWVANFITAAITWVVVKLGLDSATAASVAAPAAGLAANWLWAEYKTLPDYVRQFLRKINEDEGAVDLAILLIVLGLAIGVLVSQFIGVVLILVGFALLVLPIRRP